LQILPYSDLLEALQMPTIRDLEDLIIDAIYLDILRGKLDQKEQQLEVEYTMGRDLEPGKLEEVLAALKSWCVWFVSTVYRSNLYSQGINDVRRPVLTRQSTKFPRFPRSG
jgi:hypothetical protein